MADFQTFRRSLILVLLSVLLTSTTYVLGGIPLMALRRLEGKAAYWTWNVTIALGFSVFGLFQIGSLFFLLATTIGLYFDLRESNKSISFSGFFSVLTSLGLSLVGTGFAQKYFGFSVVAYVKENLAQILSQPQLAEFGATMTPEMLANQLPAGLMLVLTLSLWLGITFEPNLFKLIGIRFKRFKRDSLKAFKIPDACLWILTASIAGAFFDHSYETLRIVAMNVFNVMLMVYFLQGLAVTASFFHWSKMGLFWRSLFYLVLIFQLFPFVSLLGLIEDWFDLRRRMTNKTNQTA